MDLSLNALTVFYIVILLNAFIIALIASYGFQPLSASAVRYFILSRSLQVAAIFLLTMRFSFPALSPAMSTILIVGGNCMYMVGIGYEALSFLGMIGSLTSFISRIYRVIMAGGVAAFLILYGAGVSEGIRIAVVSAVILCAMVYPVRLLLAGQRPSPLRRVIGILYLTISALFCIRIYVGIADPGITLAGYPLSWILMVQFLLQLIGSNAFVLLAKERTDAELLYMATRDGLTGILNRHAFEENARRTLHYFARKKSPVTFILFDIDAFKKINDTHGHLVGDIALKETAGMVADQIRKYDVFGRYGGDEIAILLPGLGEAESDGVAERIRRVVEQRDWYGNRRLRFTVSLGLVTLVPESGTVIETLYRLGDQALYRAKAAGGNQFVRSGPEEPPLKIVEKPAQNG